MGVIIILKEEIGVGLGKVVGERQAVDKVYCVSQSPETPGPSESCRWALPYLGAELWALRGSKKLTLPGGKVAALQGEEGSGRCSHRPRLNPPMDPSRVQGPRAYCQTEAVTFPSQLITPQECCGPPPPPPRKGAL